MGEPADLVGLSGHGGVDHVGIADDACQLRVSVTSHASLVDIGRPDDDNSVVDDARLAVDVDHLGRQDAALELAPSSEGEERDVVVRVNTLLAQAREDRVGSSADGLVLALDDEPDGRGLVGVDWVGVARKEGDDDAGSPRGALLVGLDDPVDEGVSDLVLDLDAVDDGACDEELCRFERNSMSRCQDEKGGSRDVRFSM